ncbi:hypothetical protein ASPZODRAFT_129891 [Penicilliopsis zonata CBS 506.65]|uniref:Uncharacterized protein n=1 Tax=Penicilliopsis zonata CBS 506.65 TaxID=1073090 RepID=A0A1L9SQP8_9EURO|nr:hypothetical protein ASPZODRAFT_129891 [Penicilliopsis zonata CBS 506.65]OJJ49427.1 hypothetical protein ASPZODRAFT_129891 [Penicilliopsis zonata CBS 506.65]
MSVDSPGHQSGVKSFFSGVLRPKKSRQVLRKSGASNPNLRQTASRQGSKLSSDFDGNEGVPDLPPLAPLEAHRLKYRALHSQVDKQLGERQDYTTMFHALGIQDNSESAGFVAEDDSFRPPGDHDVASLSAELWAGIAMYLPLSDAAALALASKTLLQRLGTGYFSALEDPDHHRDKIGFLVRLDSQLPLHLLCFPCARYHRRIKPGQECLQPANVVDPIFSCPEAHNSLNPPPRHRLTHGRVLPFSFVQLTTRAQRFGAPVYGIPAEALSRRWKRDGWTHNTRYLVHQNRLLVRVVSSGFADPGMPLSAQRMLLYSREDYWPFFSACAHWRDGELMDACKCALGHIPRPRATAGLQGAEARVRDAFAGRAYNPNSFTTLCNKCRPMRRCPECPSEYLIEIRLTEDKSDPRSRHFRHAIVVTRWSDLGDGSSPLTSPEWAACNGESSPDQPYDSFAQLGRRSISGIFESAFTQETIPGQRIISLNPKGVKLGENGHGWY